MKRSRVLLGSDPPAFCEELLKQKKPVLTVDRPENAALLELGVQSLAVQDVHKHRPLCSAMKTTRRKAKR